MRAACIHALGCIGEGAAGVLDSKGTLLALSCAYDCLPFGKALPRQLVNKPANPPSTPGRPCSNGRIACAGG